MLAHNVRAGFHQVRAGLLVASLLRRPPTVDHWEAELPSRLARREQRFLDCAERLIFAQPSSPYRALLDAAGYDLEALRRLVLTSGLDAALDRLRQAGVYVRIGEYKGIEPAVRQGRTFQFSERAFANPLSGALLHARSSGSRGRGATAAVGAEDVVHHARLRRWIHGRYGLHDRDVVLLATPGVGLQWAVEFALIGRTPLRWFSPVEYGSLGSPLLVTAARLGSGVRLPHLEVVPAPRIAEVARYISRVNTPRGIVVETFVNAALRLVLAAEAERLDMGDVVFVMTGEPITPRKRHQIEARGYRALPRFATTELGRVAWACAAPREADDLHVLTDAVAVRTHARAVGRDEAPVPAYLFTGLMPHARVVAVNMETGDYGGLEERSCGCFLDRAGLRLHLHTVRSFEKLTAEGITFIGPSLIEVLEEVLPQRFGGDARHYQLVEAEDAQGFTRLYLLASPSLGPLDEAALRETVLAGLGERHLQRGYGQTIGTVWARAGTLQVLRREPLETVTGKVLHLHRDRGTLNGAHGVGGA